MKKSTTNSVLIGCCALLTLLLWYFSQRTWSHYTGNVGILESSDTRTWYTLTGGPGVGANYYLGGSFVLLFAAGWLLVTAFRENNEESIAGLIALGTSGLAFIALGRWFVEFSSKPASTVMRYGSSGHYLNGAAIVCAGLALALGVLGIITMIVGRSGNSPAMKDSEAKPE